MTKPVKPATTSLLDFTDIVDISVLLDDAQLQLAMANARSRPLAKRYLPLGTAR
jgi:hypothetical protein